MIFNRRQLLGTSLAASSVLLPGTVSAADLFGTAEGADRVFAILQKNLKLSSMQRDLVNAFTASLKASESHHESPAAFRAKLANPQSAAELEAYVVQEFLVSTNYIAYAAGEAQTLAILS